MTFASPAVCSTQELRSSRVRRLLSPTASQTVGSDNSRNGYDAERARTNKNFGILQYALSQRVLQFSTYASTGYQCQYLPGLHLVNKANTTKKRGKTARDLSLLPHNAYFGSNATRHNNRALYGMCGMSPKTMSMGVTLYIRNKISPTGSSQFSHL